LERKTDELEVKVSWLGGKRSQADVREFSFVIDNPEKRGGTNRGPRPTEILLASLGGCFITTLSRIAERMRIEISKLEMTLTGSTNSKETETTN